MQWGRFGLIVLAAWALGVTLYLFAMIPAHAAEKAPEKKPDCYAITYSPIHAPKDQRAEWKKAEENGRRLAP